MRQAVFDVVSKVVGKQRPRMTKSGHVYTPKQTTEAEQAIRDAYVAGGFDPIPEGFPVVVWIDVYRECPKSSKEGPDIIKPDWDNIAKLVCDALNGLAWHDDSQITRACVTKHHRKKGRPDRIRICVDIDRFC